MNINETILDPTRRHDFVLIFDVTDGNPNGDPDAGNLPRIDPETAQGLVTDVCLKRKVRNYVLEAHQAEAPYGIFIQENSVLNLKIAEAHLQDSVKTKEKSAKTSAARDWMCSKYYDIRMFGAVMTTGDNAGQVRGPLQLTFARSVDRIASMDISITRMAVTNEKDADKERTMGRKALLPYGLYVAKGFFSPSLAKQTGVTKEDMQLLWSALANMFDLDRSASRGFMTCRGIHVFTHASSLGNAPAHRLFDRIQIEPVGTPRKFSDYTVHMNSDDLPVGITLTSVING